MGKMGMNHLRVLSSLGGSEIIGFVDPCSPKGIVMIPRFDAISSAPDFDCALIASSSAQHEKNALDVMERVSTIFIEKPLSISSSSCQKILEAADKKGVKVYVGHIERFNPAVQKLKEIIRSGWLGTPIHFTFSRLGGYPKSASAVENVIFDLAVHDIDVFSLFAEKPHVHASICHSCWQPNIIDTAQILLKSASGISASIHTNWISPTKIRSIQVTGTKGICVIDYILQTCALLGGNLLDDRLEPNTDFNTLIKTYQTSDKIEFGVTMEEPLKRELQALLDELQGKKTNLCTGTEGMEAVRLAEAALHQSTM
jgi:UDP-N-acetylglucosamine 3-dehydrogenase